jgi:hypothetical protein
MIFHGWLPFRTIQYAMQVVEDITGVPFTQSQGISDSYRWFAPELCVGPGILSTSSDIYSFAMTALEVGYLPI